MGAFLDPQHTHPGISHRSRPPGLQGNNDQFSLLVSSDVSYEWGWVGVKWGGGGGVGSVFSQQEMTNDTSLL